MTGNNGYITVDGKPFFILGGQVHNSSAYTKDSMAPLWDVLVRMHANTAEVPVYWEQIEPEEGAFDFSIVDDVIAGAREHELRLILLWFATWKNGTMKYTPGWVKVQPDRFRRVITADGFPLPVLSPHCPATLAADTAAFRA
ncbi:MAG: beta-galactosidase, partial [Chloroflexota bacterium]|nr:beta-galactosidase [Chloroflexota bacterium]